AIVLGVTWQDLTAEPGDVVPPPWYAEANRGAVMETAGGALKPAVVDLLTKGPIDFLLHWMASPDREEMRRLADWLPMFAIGPDVAAYQVPAGESLPTAVASLLDGAELPVADSPLDGVWLHRTGSFVLAARITQPATMTTEVLAVLDDRTVGEDHADAWREWLRVSNLLSLRQAP